MRLIKTYKPKNFEKFKQDALFWCNKNFDPVVILNSSNHKHGVKYDFMLAAGAVDYVSTKKHDGFAKLKNFSALNKQWLFGYFSYDLKNETEELFSKNIDNIQFPEMHFFTPQVLIYSINGLVHIGTHHSVSYHSDYIYSTVCNSKEHSFSTIENLDIKKRVEKDEYINTINTIQSHINKGDIYELNYCQEFYNNNTDINPLSLYFALNQVSPTPFSCYYKLGHGYLVSATPERFLKKSDTEVMTQPIKGTAPRGANEAEDERLKEELKSNVKERAENVMIVDLVRNDLSRSAIKGSVKVEELCGIYSFSHVHQMISTITCQVSDDTNVVDIIKNAFPMGSMTGAPKIEAMNLIEKYEKTKRGLYSGAVGYITPWGDFDFNVIIRSILYNQINKYLSFMVGSAITANSSAEKEYEECLVKAQAILEVIRNGVAVL